MVTSFKILVANTPFSVALAASWLQFQTLFSHMFHFQLHWQPAGRNFKLCFQTCIVLQFYDKHMHCNTIHVVHKNSLKAIEGIEKTI